MPNKIFGILFTLLFILLIVSNSYSFQVPKDQEDIRIVVKENSTTKYLLFLINNEPETRSIEITCIGDCNIINLSWTKKEIPQYYYAFLPIEINAPEGLSTYYIELFGNGKKLNTITIETTKDQKEIMKLYYIAEKSEDIEEIKKMIINIINETTEELKRSINESANKTKEEFQKEVSEKIEEVKEKIKTEIGTGYAIATSSEKAILFIFGFLCGLIVMYVFKELRKKEENLYLKARQSENQSIKR
jgi:hypothetical protein